MFSHYFAYKQEVDVYLLVTLGKHCHNWTFQCLHVFLDNYKITFLIINIQRSTLFRLLENNYYTLQVFFLP